MNLIARLLASLTAGLLALLAVAVAVTALLDPYVWPSAMLGVPAGVVAGVATAVLSFAGLTYRDERRRTGEVSPRTRTLALASVGGVAGFVAGGVLTSALVFAGGGVGLAASMVFVGLPASLLGALLGAVAALLYVRREGRAAGPAAQ